MALWDQERLLESLHLTLGPAQSARLAIVVGHTRERPGAFGIGAIGEHEYPFNSRLARMVSRIARERGVETTTFYRDAGGVRQAYHDVVDWGADGVVELHFNATYRRTDQVRGTEMLCAGGDKENSQQLAAAIQKETLTALHRGGAEDRGVKRRWLRKRFPLAVVLAEPAFGNNEADAELLMECRRDYARAIVRGFVNYWNVKVGRRVKGPLDLSVDLEGELVS